VIRDSGPTHWLRLDFWEMLGHQWIRVGESPLA
jgi:hypothetical protein